MKRFLAALFMLSGLMVAGGVSAQDITVTNAFSASLAPLAFINLTPSGGFPTGATLKSLSITVTGFGTSTGSYVADLAFAVNVTSPTIINTTVDYCNVNSGGVLRCTSSASLFPSLPSSSTLGPSPSIGSLTVSSTVNLAGTNVWIGNAWSGGAGTWTGSVTYVYSAPSPAPIPSLSEWAQLMLGLMVISMLGWHFHRERSY